jgi:acetyl esterase
MKPDDDIHEYLERQAALGLPPAWELPLALVRQGMRDVQAARSERFEVAAVREQMIAGPGGQLQLRIYSPVASGQGAALPLLVFFHGGGFVLGDLDTHDHSCRRLCHETGAVVVAVDYRLAPEAPCPAAAQDAIAATRWCIENAAALDAASDRVIVFGDSACGNLATVAALALREEAGPQPAGQVLLYPVTDLRDGDYPSRVECAEGYGLTEAAMEWFRSLYAPTAEQQTHPHASPLAADDLSGLPPTLVITSRFDPLCSEGDAYAERLRQAGVAVEHIRLEGAIHGIFNNVETFAASGELWNAAVRWVRRTVGS